MRVHGQDARCNMDLILVLILLGICKKIHMRSYTVCGTPEYLAPELMAGHGYSFPIDWWAVPVKDLTIKSADRLFHASTHK